MDGERKDAVEIKAKSIVDVKADFQNQRICYWLNEKLQVILCAFIDIKFIYFILRGLFIVIRSPSLRGKYIPASI
jgi:hypothetical protein